MARSTSFEVSDKVHLALPLRILVCWSIPASLPSDRPALSKPTSDSQLISSSSFKPSTPLSTFGGNGKSTDQVIRPAGVFIPNLALHILCQNAALHNPKP